MRSITVILFLLSLQSTYSQEFAPGVDISKSVGGLSDVFAADLDGDGDPDLLSASSEDSKIAWYENDGSGIFSDQKIISTQLPGANAVSAADLDGDTDLDVFVVAAHVGRIVAQFENLGSGTFGPMSLIDTTAVNARDILATDLNGDGDLDLVVARGNRVQWYSNNGQGEFSDFSNTITIETEYVRSISASDLDGDGDMDLLSASWSDDKVAWYENNGSGYFGSQQILGSLFRADDVTSADLDGDGDMDVVASSDAGWNGAVIWFENYGSGSFSNQQVVPNNVNAIHRLTVTDLDSDNDLDILSAQWYDQAISWHENDGSGNFSPQQDIIIDLYKPNAVVALDTDADGDVDIVGGAANVEDIVAYSNDGSQSFSGNGIFSTDVPSPKSLALGDLNGDMTPDIVTHSLFDNTVLWYPNAGNGDFGEVTYITSDLNNPSMIRLHDIDMDGDNDVLVARQGSDEILWFENDGTGSFPTEYTASELESPRDFRIGDIDDDGDPDIIAVGVGIVSWWENTGTGDFVLAQSIENTQANQHVNLELADLDGDNDLDVAISFSFDDLVVWHRNNGLGVFGPATMVTEELSVVQGVTSADIDLDGDVDLLMSSSLDSERRVYWSANDGEGNFGAPIIIPYSSSFTAIFNVADVDTDGDPDIVLCGDGNTPDIWLENDGTASFLNSYEFSSGNTDINDIAIADMDGDSDMDIVAASEQSRILWFEDIHGDGCTDPAACNYDADAFINNGTCCYQDCACFNPSALNFDPEATCETTLCDFQVLGTVFHDENSNGILDGNEYGLADQEVLLLPDSLILTTNDQGQLNTVAAGSSQYTFIHILDEAFPIYTTPDTLSFSSAEEDWSQQLNFGLSANELQYDLEVEVYADGETHLCNAPRLHNICFENLGNVPIDGIVELEYDTLYQGYAPITGIDSVQGNQIFMSFDSLQAGAHLCYDILLQMPTVEHIGHSLVSIARVYGYSEGTQVSYGESTLESEVTCAYDPNDKQVFPHGYSGAHYIADNEQLEYLIRFQNTGNAPATDVLIRDTIDPGLDLSTFHLLANSHSVFTTIDPNSREVEFYFQDIQLPDSISNEAESHGLVSYRLSPLGGLPLLTELRNTAYIYFDNNPPIVTNTTWSILYDCSLFEVEVAQEGNTLSSTEADEYQWYLDGNPLTGATEQVHEALLPGAYAVKASTLFPCSKTSSLLILTEDDLPEEDVSSPGAAPIMIAPNPMTVSAVIEVNGLSNHFLMEVFDLEGRRIRSERRTANEHQFTLERGDLRSGQYLLRLTDEVDIHELPFIVE